MAAPGPAEGGREGGGGGMSLLVHPPAWGLPSACPECLRACAYLALALVPHSCVPCPAQITGNLPILEDYSVASRPSNLQAGPDTSASAPSTSSAPPPQGRAWPAGAGAPRGPVVVLPSTVVAEKGGLGAEGYLRVCRGIDLDAALSEPEKLELAGLQALVEAYLGEALEEELWGSPDNDAATRDLFAGALPWPVSSLVLWQQRRQRRRAWALRRRGAPSLGEAQGEDSTKQQKGPIQSKVYLKALEAYSTLSARLGSQELFFSERPTSLDAALYAHLAFLLRAPLVQSALKERVSKLPPLLQFVDRMEQRLKRAAESLAEARADGTEPPPLPFTRIPPLRPHHPSREKVEENKRKKQEAESKMGGRLFIVGQVVAICAYLAFHLFSLEVDFVEEDEDEDDGGDEEEEEDD